MPDWDFNFKFFFSMSVLAINQQLGFGLESSNSNAGAFISLLREQDNDFKELALDRLMQIVDTQWSEISEFIGEM
jgi:hypothetical protein